MKENGRMKRLDKMSARYANNKKSRKFVTKHIFPAKHDKKIYAPSASLMKAF